MKISWTKIKQIIPPLPSYLQWIKPVLGITLIVSSGIIGMRQLGWWESWELKAYDQFIRSTPADFVNDKIVLIEITEQDLQIQDRWPISDEVMFQLLSKLEAAKPVVIGLDIYRDLPVDPGYQTFANYLKNSDILIPICQIGTPEGREIPPPRSIPLEQVPEKVGFPDIIIDNDGIVRRGLIFLETDPNKRCNTPYSLSFQVARRYLETKGILPELTQDEQLKFGSTVFKRLNPKDGGYFNINTNGYQVLLNYYSVGDYLYTLTLEDILKNRYNPEFLKDKIIFVGSTATSLKDKFYTPYSANQETGNKTPGVILHAQLTSQIIDAVEKNRKLFVFWPEWTELLMIIIATTIGAGITYSLRSSLYLIIGEIVIVISLIGGTWIIFLQKQWIPIVAPGMGLLSSSILMIAYSNYETQQKQKAIEAEKKAIALKVQEQNQNIALLQAILRDRFGDTPEAEKQTEVITPTNKTLQQEATALNQSFAEVETSLSDHEATGIIVKENTPTAHKTLPILAGRYQVINVLGSGGFSATYLAEDIQLPDSAICVVKQLKVNYNDDEFLQIARRLFKTEAEILAQVGHHPQIPSLLAHFEEKQQFYLVQEYIPGELLNAELKSKTTLPEKEVIIFLKDLLEILDYIHDYGVIHRDIKPGNIIRSSQINKFVLIDFGAVKQMQPQELNNPNAFTVAIGTKGYIPPEQYGGYPQFSSDIYALGMTAIEALSGTPPYKLAMNRSTGTLEWKHLVSINEKLLNILDRMVRYHFHDRYQSAKLVLEDLAKI